MVVHRILSAHSARYSVFSMSILSLKVTSMSSTDRIALSDLRIQET